MKKIAKILSGAALVYSLLLVNSSQAGIGDVFSKAKTHASKAYSTAKTHAGKAYSAAKTHAGKAYSAASTAASQAYDKASTVAGKAYSAASTAAVEARKAAAEVASVTKKLLNKDSFKNLYNGITGFMGSMFTRYKLTEEDAQLMEKMSPIIMKIKQGIAPGMGTRDLVKDALALTIIPNGTAKDMALDIFNYVLKNKASLSPNEIKSIFAGILNCTFRQKMPINLKIMAQSLRTALLLAKRPEVVSKTANNASKLANKTSRAVATSITKTGNTIKKIGNKFNKDDLVVGCIGNILNVITFGLISK